MSLANNKPYRDLKLFMGNADAALSTQELGLRVVECELRGGPYDPDKLKKYAARYDVTVNLKDLSSARHVISMNNILLLFARFEQFVFELNKSIEQPLFPENTKITEALDKCSNQVHRIGALQDWETLEMAVGYYRILRDITAHPKCENEKKGELASYRNKTKNAKRPLNIVLGLDGSYDLPEGIYVGYEDCVICSRALKVAAWQMTVCLAVFGEAERSSLVVELKQQFSSCFVSNPDRFKVKSVRHLQSKYRLDPDEAKYLYELVIKGF